MARMAHGPSIVTVIHVIPAIPDIRPMPAFMSSTQDATTSPIYMGQAAAIVTAGNHATNVLRGHSADGCTRRHG
jgi:hypothetical protein